MRAFLLTASSLLALAAVSGTAAHPNLSVYWSRSQANTALVGSAWGATHLASRDVSCSGHGGHIHDSKGTALHRHFLCLVTRRNAKKKKLDLGWVWVHAGANPLVGEIPPDLARNPRAQTPPPGWQRQYLSSAEAKARLRETRWARGLRIDWRFGLCRGAGHHYHTGDGTFFRHFRCRVALKTPPAPEPKAGEWPRPPVFGPIRSVWMHVNRDGSIRLTKERPTDLWP